MLSPPGSSYWPLLHGILYSGPTRRQTYSAMKMTFHSSPSARTWHSTTSSYVYINMTNFYQVNTFIHNWVEKQIWLLLCKNQATIECGLEDDPHTVDDHAGLLAAQNSPLKAPPALPHQRGGEAITPCGSCNPGNKLCWGEVKARKTDDSCVVLAPNPNLR